MTQLNVVQLRDEPRLSDIPGMLRNMADKIDAGEMGDVESLVLLIHRPADWPEVYGWGDNLGELGMIAILELAKGWMMNNRTDRA